MNPQPLHFGRSWGGPGPLEEGCPCPKAPCGLVESTRINPACTQHPWHRTKTVRSSHPADDCPGPE